MYDTKMILDALFQLRRAGQPVGQGDRPFAADASGSKRTIRDSSAAPSNDAPVRRDA